MQPQQPANYDFIVNSGQQQRKVLPSSPLKLIALISGGVVLLLILGIGIVNMLKGSDPTGPAMISVLQQQQELLHITEEATNHAGISSANSTSAATIQLSIATEQHDLLNYLGENKFKISQKELALGIKPAIDTSLKTAAEGGNYNAVFRSTLKEQLTIYKQHLVRAYSTVKGPRGRELLKQDVAHADLLLTQVDTASPSSSN